MRLFTAAAALAVVLAACERDQGRSVSRTDGAPAAGAAAPSVSAAEADFVGVWAANSELCASASTWRLTADRVATAGGVSCAIEGAARSPAGWLLQATCTAEGPPAPAQITLGMDGSAASQAMTVQGGPFAGPVTLIRCTPALSAAPGA